MEAAADRVEARLVAALCDAPALGERLRPERLMAAMRHGSLDGGKRLRPFLVMETAALFGVATESSVTAATAIECVHCYSLIHDDLPAMDNDLLRRGRPTVHAAFGEATAILAGDALLTLAFDLLSGPDAHPDPAVRIALVQVLARASGMGGMVGGQMLDLAAEGRFGDGTPLALPLDAIRDLQAMKTGALLAAAVEMGARLGGATDVERGALAEYGRALGAAFQIADDILDLEGSAEEVGKAVGKDAAAGKATVVSALGRAAAGALLVDLVESAKGALAPFGARAEILKETAVFVAARRK
ncbi:polyprenyl synthetase family protein [Aquabacter sp. L1I39]|uniref:polyprenyl synthetase family protein n=1 Tax=Aquabacter sp. L1I39 TaxID=2820278 RepID=UPI001AD9D3FC|nr:farnesyl diphosphate synthase [Aquabacter sp. L1I39]QTL06083.1 polyprenyl synthetase family protein [Aquabacter sp. L1I39]